MRVDVLREFIASLRGELAGESMTEEAARAAGARARELAGSLSAIGLAVSPAFLGILAAILGKAVAEPNYANLARALLDDLETSWSGVDAFTPERDRLLEGLRPKWELFADLEVPVGASAGADAPEAAPSAFCDILPRFEAPFRGSPPRTLAPARTQADFDYGRHGEGIDDFTAEGMELVNSLERDLMGLAGADAEMLHRIFRCAHTFKGMCGILEVTPAYHLTHEMEALLEKVRDGKYAVTTELENVLLECVDYLRRIVGLMTTRENPLIDCADLTTRVKAMTAAGGQAAASPTTATAAATNDGPPIRSTGRAEPVEGRAEKAAPPAPGSVAQSFLRVETGKLNSVMEQVGEILVERIKLDTRRRDLFQVLAALRKTREERQDDQNVEFRRLLETLENFAARFAENVETINRVTSDLQDSVMKMRLVPLAQVFARFPRLVRDLSRKLEKKVELVIEGDETEIDKGVCEQLPEPLVHLIRNSIDHGLEDAATRLECGKDETGRILLKAFHEGDKVVIEISDDGRGLNEEKITATAVKRGLVTPEEAAHLSPQQKLRLIFQPGFSTAETVTDVSGRGVGMDVVRATVEKLSGIIDVATTPGEGATVQLKLPLTMAILGILLFRLKKGTLALPLHNVRETLILPIEEVHESNNRQVINLRGEIVPILSLADILGVPTTGQPSEKAAIIIVEVMEKIYGLIVDEFLGKTDIIIKNFGEILKKTPYISGGAIMGNGRVVPVLDPTEIIRDGAKSRPVVAAARVEPAATPPPGARKRVLVVEDSRSIARYLADLLRSNGYDVEIASSGEEGLAIAKRNDFDVVSTDIIMPGIDGYEFARQLRSVANYSLKPIVALSQKREHIDRIKGFQAGIDEYLTKPVQEEIYLGIIQALAAR